MNQLGIKEMRFPTGENYEEMNWHSAAFFPGGVFWFWPLGKSWTIWILPGQSSLLGNRDRIESFSSLGSIQIWEVTKRGMRI